MIRETWFVKDVAHVMWRYFCMVYNHVGKADLSKGVEIKKKSGANRSLFRDNQASV